MLDHFTSARGTTSSRQIALLTMGMLFFVWSMLAYWAMTSRQQTLENRKAALLQTVAVVEEQSAQMLSLIRVALFCRSLDRSTSWRRPGGKPRIHQARRTTARIVRTAHRHPHGHPRRQPGLYTETCRCSRHRRF